MNINFILPSLRKCAPNDIAVLLIDYLLSKNINVKVFIFNNYNEYSLSCEVSCINFSKFIKIDKDELVHSMGFFPDCYLGILVILQKVSRFNVITTIHSDLDKDIIDLYGHLKGLFYSIIWLFFILFIGNHVFLNRFQRKRFYLLSYFSSSRVIPNGYNFSNVQHPRNNLLTSKYYNILFVGSLRKLKGIDLLVSAMPYIVNSRLHIFGDGPLLNKLVDFTNDSQIADRVIFYGHKKNPFSLLDNVDLLVVPSRSEGFSMVVLEAANNSIPILCSDIGSLHSLYCDVGISFYKNNSLDSLISELKFILSSQSNHKAPCYARLKDMYAAESMQSKYFSLYNSIYNLRNS